ncbi:hypothetical protein [Ewingella americana]|uniref:hypothetical protein n=1 Tax=Ewingella americana TaxID=41202 RepID=UPI0012AD6A09|nr:hypothetical protein [Ewingella americana]MRT06062.1 hypothetical protein [Ewingella americana]
MSTQNVNTAAPESTERCSWVKPHNVIADQQSLLLRLADLWNLQLAHEEEEEEVTMLILQLAENVWLYGVTDWSCELPKISWDIAYFWFQAQKIALSLYELKGARAVEYAHCELAERLAHGKHKRERKRQAA